MPKQTQPEQLLFGVFDGEQPATWAPWKRPLSDLQATIRSDRLLVTESEAKNTHFQVSLLLQGRTELLEREAAHLVPFTGILVDGLSHLGNLAEKAKIKSDFDALCARLAAADPLCWFRKVGFYIVVATGNPVDDETLEFTRDLERIVETRLGLNVFSSMQLVNDDDTLVSATQLIEYQMVSQHRRRLMSSSK